MYLIFLLLICSLIISIYFGYSIVVNLRDISQAMDIFIEMNSFEEGYESDIDSGINPDIIKRDEEYDAKIKAMKEELFGSLGLELDGQESIFDMASDAEILNDDIYNIPHQEVPIVKNKEEFAD